MNIYQVSEGWGGSLSFEVIEEIPKEKTYSKLEKYPLQI